MKLPKNGYYVRAVYGSYLILERQNLDLPQNMK